MVSSSGGQSVDDSGSDQNGTAPTLPEQTTTVTVEKEKDTTTTSEESSIWTSDNAEPL